MKIICFLSAILLNVLILAQDYQKVLGDLYNSGKIDEVLIKAKEYIKSDSANAQLNLILGRALVDKGLFSEGLPYLQKVVNNNKNKNWMRAWGMNYLGRIYLMRGDKSISKQYFIDCINLNATKNVTRLSKLMLVNLGYDDFYSNFETIESKHITFHFQPNSVVTNKAEFIDLRENAFIEINNFFEVKIPKKIEFFVWNSNHDAKEIGLRELGFAIPQFCIIHSMANQTLGHELTHIISNYISDKKIETKFIKEGVAVCFDLSKENKLQIAKKLKETDSVEIKVSIKKAWKDSKAYPEWVYYSLAGEFVHRLLDRWGKEKLIELLKNQTYENALSIYGDELNKIINELENEIN